MLLHLQATISLQFVHNSFTTTTPITLSNDSRLEPPIIRLTNDRNQFSIGKAFHHSPIQFRSPNNSNSTISFSAQFIFSILPQISTSPGFGIAFFLCNSTSFPNALGGQYLGVFNSSAQTPAPLLAIEFDTDLNQEFNDPDTNHVGIDLNSIISVVTQTAGYYNGSQFVPVNMRNGQNIHAWIEFDGTRNEINVTIAPAGMERPSRAMLSYRDEQIGDYVGDRMFVGFSASKTQWIEAHRVLAWSYNDDAGVLDRDANTTSLPVFELANGSNSLSQGSIVGTCDIGLVEMAEIRGRKRAREEGTSIRGTGRGRGRGTGRGTGTAASSTGNAASATARNNNGRTRLRSSSSTGRGRGLRRWFGL